MVFGRHRPRKPPHLFLALFFGLLALNQGLEGVRALSPAHSVLLYRLATAAAVVDPFVMFYFSGLYPRRVVHPTSPSVLATFAGTVLLLCATPFVSLEANASRADVWFEAFLVLWTAALYFVALRRFYRAWWHDPEPLAQHRLPLLFLAACVAFVPIFFRAALRLYDPLIHDLLSFNGVVLPLSGFLVPYSLLILLGYAAWRSAPVAHRSALAWCLGAGIAAVPLVQVYNVGLELLGRFEPALFIAGQASASLRWLAFCALASVELFRHDSLGLDPRDRQRAARAFTGLGFVVLASLALVLLRAVLPLPLPGLVELVALGAALVLSQGFQSLVDRTAQALFGVPAGTAVGRAGEGGPVTDLRPAPGRVLAERYRVEEFLARGGESRVYRAHDLLLGRSVVLKELPHEGPAATDRALREARVAGALHHPGVLQVYDVLRGSDRTLLVTEYAPRGSLADRVAAHGPLPMVEGLAFLDDVLGTLAAVHGQGLVHCDLKPANLLLSIDGRPRVADFGIARLRGATARFDHADAFLGTPEYMAPEQRVGRPATERTDLYAVALVARRCLAGPLPPPVEAVLDRALAERPEERWPSAAAMRDALRAARLPVAEHQ